jgi:excisionase family DNA binding protein
MEYVTVRELGRLLKRSEQAIRDDIKRGRIPAIKTGPRGLRIDLEEALRAFPCVGRQPDTL